MLSRLSLFFTLVSVAFSMKEVPERARGGRYWKEYMNKHGLLKGSANTCKITTWNAQIDNFDDSNADTYAQRYFVDDSTYDGTDHQYIFLEIGGEGTLSCPNGYINTLAAKPEYSALVVALEHRYYGESLPTNSETRNLEKYLTVQNALADLNGFTSFFKESYNMTNAKVFVFGGSYPGGLASWYRIQYPDASVGSLSSSGVVNPIIDFVEFDEAVSRATANQCADRVRRTQLAFENIVAKGNYEWAKDLFHCESDSSSLYLQDFYYMMADSWSMAVQYSSKSSLCDAIMVTPEDASDEEFAQTFASFSNDFWGADFCNNGFYNTAQLSSPKTWDVNSRSWRFQTCKQVAWFNTAPKSGSLRGEIVSLDYHLKQCAEIFGKKMIPHTNEMHELYGGDTPTADRVFYSDFSDDPWAPASVQYPVGSNQPYIYAMSNDLGHCSDLHTPSEDDPQALKDCRTEFETYLKKWLTE